MMYLFRLLPFLCLSFVMACSDSSGGGAATASDLDNGAVETCYDVRVSYTGSNQLKNICTTREYGDFNGLGVNRFMRFSLGVATTVSIDVARTSGLDPADPDLVLYRNGQVIQTADSTQFNNETLAPTQALVAGDYVLLLNEYVYSASNNKVQGSTAVRVKQAEAVTRSLQQKTLPDNNIQFKNNSTCDTTDEITVSGFALFERVIPRFISGSISLDYANSQLQPVQQALVEVICNSGVYSSTISAADGSYNLALPFNQQSIVRVRAQMLQTGTSNWNFSIVDNTTPGQPVYVMDQVLSPATVARTSVILQADSGWDNNFLRYTGPRVAAPFAILDSVRKAKDKVLAESASFSFPELKINWSVNNTTSPLGTLESGAIESSFFDGNEIYLLGAADNDTDEYDEHVIIHEWSHYFEDFFSRSDSIGGVHSFGDILDPRVVFGEGFGNALSAMITDDPLYIDTNGRQQNNGFTINLESNACVNAGWYSECSIQSILYDIYDTDNDMPDSVSMGFSPVLNVLRVAQKNTAALTTIFSFIDALKNQNPASANGIDALTSGQSIDPILDIYGGSQFSNNPGATDQLPVYELF